jgi:hypothetical protein
MKARCGMAGIMRRLALLATGLACASLAAGALPAPLQDVHEHASFAWYILGEPLSFRNAAYDCFAARICDDVHLHTAGPEGDPNDVLHIEGSYPGGQPTWNLSRIFGQYGMVLRPDSVRLDARGTHNGTLWSDHGGAAWALFVSKGNASARQPWQRVPGDWTAYVPRDVDKLLITYGDPSNRTQLAREEVPIADAWEWTVD